jgi:hypothetical protein
MLHGQKGLKFEQKKSAQMGVPTDRQFYDKIFVGNPTQTGTCNIL